MLECYVIAYIVYYPDGNDQGGDYRVTDMPDKDHEVGTAPYGE